MRGLLAKYIDAFSPMQCIYEYSFAYGFKKFMNHFLHQYFMNP